MLQAGKIALITLSVAMVLIALMQPRDAYASQSTSSVDLRGQSVAVGSSLLASKPTFATFTDHHLLLESMLLAPEPIHDRTVYAAPKLAVTSPSASAAATPQPQSVIEEHHIDTISYALQADTLFDMVNEHRTSIGLPALQKDDRLMDIARSRAPEIFDEIFVNHNMHAGFYGRNLPYWATENIIYHHSEESALQWWLHSPVHRHAIEGDYQFAGIGCDGKACSMIFSNFEPK